jgi:ribosomal protein L34
MSGFVRRTKVKSGTCVLQSLPCTPLATHSFILLLYSLFALTCTLSCPLRCYAVDGSQVLESRRIKVFLGLLFWTSCTALCLTLSLGIG